MARPRPRPVLAADPNTDYLGQLADRLHAMGQQERDAAWLRVAPMLNRHSLELLERLIADRTAVGWRADPWTMARHLEGDAVEDWSVARYTARKFREAVTGEGSRFQVWNQPAQTGKTAGLRRGVVWALDRDPADNIIWLSYGDTLARESAIAVRDTALAHADQLRFGLRPDLRRQDRWVTTEGGGMLATGLGGGAAGYPAGGVIVDDPLKNWQAAHSPTQRDAAWNEIVAVARLRLREGGWFILAHTRWHLDDPTGRMRRLADELGIDVEFVVMPMIAGDDDPLGRAPGDVLEPRRYSLDEARSRASFLGSYLAAALEQQDPQPEEGGEIKREWWRWYTDRPAQLQQVCTSWDMKLKDKSTGDYVVGLALGRVGGAYYVLDMWRGQWTVLRTKVAMALAQVRTPTAGVHYVENTGNGPEVMAELRDGDPTFVLDADLAGEFGMTDDEADAVVRLLRHGLDNLVAVTPQGSKLVRVRAHTIPKVEAGNVYLPSDRHWPQLLVDEHAAFPPRPGGHDDIVDALSQGLHRIGAAQASATVSTGQVGRVPRGRPAGVRR